MPLRIGVSFFNRVEVGVKYIHGVWPHFFKDSRNRESMTRIVVDTERQVILFGQVATDFKDSEPSVWRDMVASEKADILDSLVSGNPEVFDEPADYGLDSADELPQWAPPLVTKPARRRAVRNEGIELAPDDLF